MTDSPLPISRRASFAVVASLISLLALLLAFPPLTAESQGLQFGTGWQGQAWNNLDFSGQPVHTLVIPAGLNFNWGLGSPDPTVNVDNWSARFDSVQVLNQGTYEFITSYDDAVRIYIDNILVLDRFNGPPASDVRFQQTLTAGAHLFRVEFREFTDTALLLFAWQQISGLPPGVTPGFATVTPFGTPVLPTGTPTPAGPQASVAGVRGLAMRTGPYLGASFITTITPETPIVILGRNRDEGIYNWYFVQVGERRGWVSGRYLRVNVPDINQIPVIGAENFDNIDGAPDIGARAITRAVMNVRRRPSPRVEIVGSIPWGGVAELIGRTVQAGTNRWLHVRYYTDDGRVIVGWIDARWVTVQGELFNVPIR
jgi:uncharacterized protein YraI